MFLQRMSRKKMFQAPIKIKILRDDRPDPVFESRE